MRAWILPIILLIFYHTASSQQQKKGLVIKRKVRILAVDLVNRPHEYLKKETIKIKNGNIKIQDSFQKVLIIRTDKKLVWKIDLIEKTYSEANFETIKKSIKSEVDKIKSAQKNVKGTDDEKEIDRILAGFGEIKKNLKVQIKWLKPEQTIADVKTKRVMVILGKERLIMNAFISSPDIYSKTYYLALKKIGALIKQVDEKIIEKIGFPLKGNFWHPLFLKRLNEQIIDTYHFKQEEIEDKEFELPQGYKRVPFSEIGEQPRRAKAKARLTKGFEEDELELEETTLPEE
jgi:hypothetical protein